MLITYFSKCYFDCKINQRNDHSQLHLSLSSLHYNIIQQKDFQMQGEECDKIKQPIQAIQRDKQFDKFVNQLLTSQNAMDELLLTKINEAIEMKNVLESHEISSLTLIIALAFRRCLGGWKNVNQNLQSTILFKNICQLKKMIYQQKRPCKEKIQRIQLMVWISKIWDRILHFSSTKNYLDLLILFFYLGQFLFYPEQQLKRLSKLLLQTVSKIKPDQSNTSECALMLLNYFIIDIEEKKYSQQTKTKLKMIQIIFMTKIYCPSAEQIQILRLKLAETHELYLQSMIDNLQRAEDNSLISEEEVIWDKLFASLLKIYTQLDATKDIVRKILIEMISYKLDLQAVKLLIRELQITNERFPVKKWKQMFRLMQIALKIYDTSKECLVFQSSKSFIKQNIPFHPCYIQMDIKTCLKTCKEQKILIMIQDKLRTQQLWVSIRNHIEGQALIILLKVSKGIIWQKTQKQIKWNQFKSNTIAVELTSTEISIIVNNSEESMLSFQRFIDNPVNYVIGDEDGNFGTSIRSLIQLSIYNNKKRDNGICTKMEINNTKTSTFKLIRKKVLPSFVQLIGAVGDLDIFLMIISHAIKKMKKNNDSSLIVCTFASKNNDIVCMIRQAIHIMQQFVEIKKVKNKKVTPLQKQKRLNTILCLCWQCSHQSSNALAVLELLRVLSIRGVNNPDDELQILCNFVFWKQFDWQYQKIIIMKIKQIFCQIRNKQSYNKIIHKYCKRIFQQTALYYRQDDYISHGPDSKDNILKIHYEFIILVQEQLIFQLNSKKDMELYHDFIEFTIKLLYWTINRRNNNAIEAFDITFSVELSILARLLGARLTQWENKEEKLLRIIKCIIQVCGIYDIEQQFYEDKNIKIYTEQRSFVFFDDRVIKSNLYFLAFELISLKDNILHSIMQLDEKGIMQINCIIWQKQFFQKSISYFCQQEIKLQQNKHKLQKLQFIFDRLPLKSLSTEQSKMLLTIYLNNEIFFKEIDYRLSQHFWKIISIKDLLQILLLNIKDKQNKQSEITATSKTKKESFRVQSSFLKCNKILTLLAFCQELTYKEGLSVLQQLTYFYDPIDKKLNFMINHFILKGLVQKTEQMMHNLQGSATFISSLSAIDIKIQSSLSIQQIDQQSELNMQKLITCLQFYFKIITKTDILKFKGITNQQQAEGHLQNYKINLERVINSLSSCDVNSISKLKNYYQFLEKLMLPLSKYYIQTLHILPFVEYKQFKQRNRKGSKNNIQLPVFNFQEESKNMYLLFLDQRNENLLKVQKVWSQVEQKNKYFWSTFLGKQVYYRLYQATGPFNQKYLLKKDTKKPKLQLPRMQKSSSIRNASIMSERFQFNQQNQSTSSIFDDAHLYRKQPTTCLSNNPHHPQKEGHKNNKFKVLLITSSKIYQGSVSVHRNKLAFKENQIINFDLYDKIFAAQCQQRYEDQCKKQNYKFEEQLSNKCIAIVKRYLFHDLAVELHTKNRSYFFSFIKKDHRQAFLFLLEKYMKVLHREKLSQEAKILNQKWQIGLISNYHYLMKINDITGRSFNDLSQYYVFPWTIFNFNQQIDSKFLQNKDNFRDLSLPVGKLNKKKWQDIKKKYQSKKQNRFSNIEMPVFLFGSFYSNPAVVCNFLIRVDPFSSQHYQLQSNQFDLADRLFYSITDSYKSLMNCSSDFKELIPQFYYFSDFLKNRNYYNLGSRQNTDLVDHVALPVWAQDQFQFVFKMRKILECQIVTKGLNSWIDLIFGVYAKKQYAIKADNLFLGDLYIEGFQKYLLEKDKSAIQLFKQFGQVPVPVIHNNLIASKIQQNYFDSITNPSMKIEEQIVAKSSEIGKIIQIYFYKRFTLLLFDKQIRMYQQQNYNEKDYISVNGQFEGGSLAVWEILDSEGKKHYCVIVLKKKSSQILGYQIKKSIFNNYNLQGGDLISFKHKCQLFCLYQNIIFCSEGKSIYIYKNVQEEMEEFQSNRNSSHIINIAKKQYLFMAVTQFVQHKARITHIQSNERGIIISLDEQNRIFVLEIESSKLNIFNVFELKNTYFQEKVIQMQIHNMGFLLFRTDYDRLLVYSFMGDYIFAKYLKFSKSNEKMSAEKALNIAIWNQELSEIIVCTDLGKVWKIDLFQLRKMEEIVEKDIWIQKIHLNKEGFRKEKLLKSAVNRIGRHSILVIYAENNKIYSIKSRKWEEAKKTEILGKKNQTFW